MTIVNNVLDTLIISIAKKQKNDGSFSYESSHNKFFTHTNRTSIFYNSLISQSLSGFKDDKRIKSILEQLNPWILKQASTAWTFNYWDRQSTEYNRYPLPDDIDDTCCALSTVFMYEPDMIDGNILAHMTHILVNQESQPGGPYKTWITDKRDPPWDNIDIGVNVNIGFFLSQMEISLDGLNNYITKHIDAHDFKSDFYISPLFIIFLLSRWYIPKNIDKLIKLIHIYLLKATSTETILGYSALMNYHYLTKYDEKEMLKFLQHTENFATIDPLSIDIKIKTKKYIAASSNFLLSLAINLIKKSSLIKNPKKSISMNPSDQDLSDKIYDAVEKKISKFPKNIQNNAHSIISLIKNYDRKHIISLTPYYFYLSLKIKSSMGKNILMQLGMANIFGWAAYTIYDDFYDNEGDSHKLAAAHILFRQFMDIYEKIFISHPLFKKELHTILNRIDSENQKEIDFFRLKTNKIILKKIVALNTNFLTCGKKSIGHALGPLYIFHYQGYEINSNQYKKLYRFFLLYLSIRQMSDDMHDWLDDLHKGIITDVSINIFNDAFKLGYKVIDIQKNADLLVEIFWNISVKDICKKILFYHTQASSLLKEILPINNHQYLMDQIDHYKNIAVLTLNEREKTQEFLKNYR